MRKFIWACRHVREYYPSVKKGVKRWLIKGFVSEVPF